MKKKNDGGYSLALVLVVMTVIAVIATTLTTVVLSNIKSQSQFTQKVQAQYEAQGKLEKVLAELSQNQISEIQHDSMRVFHQEAIDKAISKVCGTDVIYTVIDEIELWEDDELKKPAKSTKNDTIFTYEFSLKAQDKNEDVSVCYIVRWKGNIACSFSPQKLEGNRLDTTHMYFITSPEITYKSIDVTGMVSNDGGGE